MHVSVLLLSPAARSVFVVLKRKNMCNHFQACRNAVTGAFRPRSAAAVSLSGVSSVNETELLAYGK